MENQQPDITPITTDLQEPVAPAPVVAEVAPTTNAPLLAAMIGIPLAIGLVVMSLFLLGRAPQAEHPSPQQSGQEKSTETTPNAPTVARTMDRYYVENAAERNALCNDGSPAAYYFRAGTQDHAEDWVVHLHGGFDCKSAEECEARAQETPMLVSSKPYKATITSDGILSASAKDNPDFYNWNHVEVMYCSSDLWGGTKDSEINGETWHFQGHAIVQAVMEDLQNPEIIETRPLGEGSKLIFSGSSAGGAGVWFNLDKVAEMLPGVETVGLVDSAFPTTPAEVYAEVEAVSLEDAQALRELTGDESCMEANEVDAAPCARIDSLYHYIETPVYVFQFQLDPGRLKDLGVTNVNNKEQIAYVKEVFLPAFAATLADVDPLFAPYQVLHTALTSERFYEVKIDGVSFAQAFGDWYFDRGGPTRYVESAQK